MIGFGECRIGGSVVRIELDGASEQGARLHIVCARRALQCRPGAQHVVVGFEIFGRLGEHPPLFDLRHADRQGPGDLSGDLVLQGKDVRQRLVEAGRPKHSSIRIDELRDHPHAVAGLADAAFDLIAHREIAGDLSGACGLALVGEDSVPRHHGQRGKPTQRVDDVLRQSIREILTSRIVALVQERENGDRGFRADFGTFGCRQFDRVSAGWSRNFHSRAPTPRHSTPAPAGQRREQALRAMPTSDWPVAKLPIGGTSVTADQPGSDRLAGSDG